MTVKGQVVIPLAIRRKLSLDPGTRFRVSEEGGKVVLEPIREDLLKEARGMIRSRSRVLRQLLEERKEEAQR